MQNGKIVEVAEKGAALRGEMSNMLQAAFSYCLVQLLHFELKLLALSQNLLVVTKNDPECAEMDVDSLPARYCSAAPEHMTIASSLAGLKWFQCLSLQQLPTRCPREDLAAPARCFQCW
jgi:hypothetical protein